MRLHHSTSNDSIAALFFPLVLVAAMAAGCAERKPAAEQPSAPTSAAPAPSAGTRPAVVDEFFPSVKTRFCITDGGTEEYRALLLAGKSTGLDGYDAAVKEFANAKDTDYPQMTVMAFNCPPTSNGCLDPDGGTPAGGGSDTLGIAYTFQQGPPPPPNLSQLREMQAAADEPLYPCVPPVEYLCHDKDGGEFATDLNVDHRIAMARGLAFFDDKGRYLFMPCSVASTQAHGIDHKFAFEHFEKSDTVVVFREGRHEMNETKHKHRFVKMKR